MLAQEMWRIRGFRGGAEGAVAPPLKMFYDFALKIVL